ncbi:hypothetical protein DCCM_3235 [Desulfocucumis palustris]|uniref:Uncharacterized protein n=1 Tax=Desulfocucumis palustris TaxID=1898651 RepID=A0A2L2XEI8_9FIRM|nr:hypothetical protein [Desulfocucumis palustris]GBF34123.1 hypothetical protein DCCM_3235 [Desulfocucumis palustris]
MRQKPGCCWLKFLGCNPADDEDCYYCHHYGEWPEDWQEAVESHEES